MRIDDASVNGEDVSPEDLADLARQVALEEALNPFHAVLTDADVLARWYYQTVKGTELELAFHGEGWGRALGSAKTKQLPSSSTIEQAGVVGAYAWLAQQRDSNVLFVNDLASEQHGFDAVAHCPARDRFLIVESKGTTRPLVRNLLSYLGHTRHKGRQLSQEWGWSSMFEFALVASTAPIALRLLAPFLEGRCDRVLVVSHVLKVHDGFRPDYWHSCVETDLSSRLPFDLDALKRQRAWLAEVKASGALAKLGTCV